jgi:hypothetical protein
LDEIGVDASKSMDEKKSTVDFNEVERRLSGMKMDVYTGEMVPNKQV